MSAGSKGMDLVDRYLNAVGKALPEAQRDDIVRELSEDIRSEVDERERALGRPINEAELQTLLRQRGNPLLLAARYRQDQRTVAFGRQLIGPLLFPFYAKVLTFNLGLTFAVIATIFVALAVGGQPVRFGEVLSTCLTQLAIQLGAVTLIFALIERHLTRHPDRWDLGGTGGFRFGPERRREGAGRVSRFESVSVIIASAVALVWLAGVQTYPFLILGPASSFLSLAPVWQQVYFPVVLLVVAEIVRAAINLVRPDWTRFRSVAGLLVHMAGLGVIYLLLRAGSWVQAADPAGAGSARAVLIVNRTTHYLLLFAGLLSVLTLALRVLRLLRRLGSQAPRVGAAIKNGN